MKYVDFFGNSVSKLIVGDNPFNGHSYITTFIPSKEMIDYHTEEKILEAMFKMEELGINTMLPLADPFIIRILTHYRTQGGKMNFIFQTYAPMMVNTETADISMRQLMKVDPIGVYISGTFTDVRYENGKNDEILGMIECLRKYDIKLGIGTHHPDVITLSEKDNWDVDFYMACMYNLRRGREGEESGFITGKNKSGIFPIQPGDRAIMLDALKDVKKPIIAFKIFAGGQMLVEKEKAEREALIEDTYNTVFSALKPNDLAVVGIYQKHHDQLTENVNVFNKWAGK